MCNQLLGDISSLLWWLVSIWESRNHIWCFFSSFFFFFVFLHMVLLIERFLCIDLVTKYSESWKKESHNDATQRLFIMGRSYYPLGLQDSGYDTRAPKCCTVETSPSQEVKALLLVADTPGLVPDAAESWSSLSCSLMAVSEQKKRREKWLLISCFLI